jgi:four helix bundle protein
VVCEAANIAEGGGKRDKGRISAVSHDRYRRSMELEYHLVLAHDLGFLSETEYRQLDNAAIETKPMPAPGSES